MKGNRFKIPLFNQKGFAPIIILVIIVALVGGVVVVSKVVETPSGQPVIDQSAKEKTTASSDSAKISGQVSKITTTISKTTSTPKPTSNATPKLTQTTQPVSTTGNLDVLLSGPEDAVPPVVRLFDEQLRMVYEDNGYQQGGYSRVANGYRYILKDLSPGKYLAGAAGNFYFKPQNITIQAGKTTNITLERNPSSTTITTTLTGRTYVDSNGNKKYDSGELDVNGVVDVDIYIVTKDGEKRVYGFSGLPGGAYNLRGTGQSFLGRYIFKSGIQPGYTPVSLDTELGLYNVGNTVDIPYITQSTFSSPSSIKGRVYVDTNGNGQYDSGEGRPSYYASLGLEKPDYEGGYRYGTVTINDNGEYSFSNLSPGKYLLKLDEVPGYNRPSQSTVTIDLGSASEQQVNFGLTR